MTIKTIGMASLLAAVPVRAISQDSKGVALKRCSPISRRPIVEKIWTRWPQHSEKMPCA
jgi:hypothetical protein